MMTRRIQMTAHNHLLHLQVAAGGPVTPKEEGPIRDKAIRLYWDIFQLLHRDPQNQSRAFSFSFEDDFDEDPEEDGCEDNSFLPRADLFQEEEGLFEEEEGLGRGLRSELFYK